MVLVGILLYHNYITIGRGNASYSLIFKSGTAPDTPQDEFVV